jgi:hypothetical protein
MALGTCPDCAGKVSTTADACLHCGNTEFLVSTGRVVDEICTLCDGSGYRERRPSIDSQFDHLLPSKEKCGCSAGHWRCKEFKDLRDGSLHLEYL